MCRPISEQVDEEMVENHLDLLNQELLDHMQRGGETFVSNAVIQGRYALRACIVNFHTATADVEAVPEIAVRLGRTLDARLRPQRCANKDAERKLFALSVLLCDEKR
jgi:hypothetical protein